LTEEGTQSTFGKSEVLFENIEESVEFSGVRRLSGIRLCTPIDNNVCTDGFTKFKREFGTLRKRTHIINRPLRKRLCDIALIKTPGKKTNMGFGERLRGRFGERFLKIMNGGTTLRTILDRKEMVVECIKSKETNAWSRKKRKNSGCNAAVLKFDNGCGEEVCKEVFVVVTKTFLENGWLNIESLNKRIAENGGVKSGTMEWW